jgi:molybdate transport system substrate-binding protein
MVRRAWLRLSGVGVVAIIAIVVAAPGTAEATHGAPAAKTKKLSGAITVSAAASLTEAFTKMIVDFEKANPGTTVTPNFAASSALVTQIQGGAPADVFASADGTNMEKLVSGGQVTAEPTVFAANALTIVVKPGNPKHVKSLADLADLGVISLCADAVPCGKYAAQALSLSGVTIPSEKITKGADVKTTLAAVTTGDADAAIVYTTDAEAAGTAVQSVKVPAWLNEYAIYPIAPIAASTNPGLAAAFVQYTASPAGQKTLRSFGFLPPPLS